MAINRITAAFVCLIMMGMVYFPATHAQENGGVLVNWDMQGGFSARDGVAGVPNGWGFRALSGRVEAERLYDPLYARSDPIAWVMRGRELYDQYDAIGYQTATVVPGIQYLAVGYAQIWACNDIAYFCVTNEGTRFSEEDLNMQVRIGLDVNGGNDPNAQGVVWSPWVQPFDEFQPMTVEATAATEQMTVFLYVDSGGAVAYNEVYWDDISLFATEEPIPANQDPAIVGPQAPGNAVPFVNQQAPRPDGSLVHVVRSGDTFDSIVLAYSPWGITRQMILERNGWRFPPNYINVNDEILILPPGSIDPNTGQLLSLDGGAVPHTAAANTVPATPTPSAPVAPSDTTDTATVPTTASTEPPSAPAIPTLSIADIQALSPVEPIDPFIPR